jgi:hypothetical protein
VNPGQWYFAGDRGTELIKAGPRGDTVYPHGESMAMLGGAGGGGVTLNVYANDAQSFGSRETQAQLTRKLRKMQGGR